MAAAAPRPLHMRRGLVVALFLRAAAACGLCSSSGGTVLVRGIRPSHASRLKDMEESSVEPCMALTAVPGYLGYKPGYARAPIPVKIAKHIGPQPSSEASATAAVTAGPHPAASEYHTAFNPNSSSPANVGPRAPGGFWFEERSRRAAARVQPFLATTTYRAELLNSAATTNGQLATSAGVPATLVGYATARAAAADDARRSLSAGGSLFAASSGRVTGGGVASSGALDGTGPPKLVGWRTTYSDANHPVADRATARAATAASGSLVGGVATSTAAVAAAGLQASRQRAATAGPRFEGTSSYARDFADGPLARHPRGAGPHEVTTLLSTTGDLNLGTTRACDHVPGYTGFVPAAATNPTACAQGAGAAPRPDAKVQALLSRLDQFSRGRLEGYTGYKPRGGAAVSAVQPAQGPTAMTAQGFVNSQLLKRGPQPRDTAHAINSRVGLMSFFSSGTNGTRGEPSISDNGLSDAQRFFARLRPLEGRMKGAVGSRTTASGARFDSVLARRPPQQQQEVRA